MKDGRLVRLRIHLPDYPGALAHARSRGAWWFWMMLALVTGDAGSTVAQVAGVLGDLRYERGDEEEADVHAMRRMQRARLDARAMARAYRMLERESEDAPRFVNYLSTHPRTADRIAFLEREAASAAYAPEPLLAGREWPPPVTCPAGQ